MAADQADDVARLAADLALHAEFSRTGYAPAPSRDHDRRRARRGAPASPAAAAVTAE